MSPEQQAAYIMAQAACAMATIAGMQAENQHRISVGRSDLYTEEAFEDVTSRYTIGHNDVISFFTGR
jgi:hypothetical protein